MLCRQLVEVSVYLGFAVDPNDTAGKAIDIDSRSSI
jgi:hypothetical protein